MSTSASIGEWIEMAYQQEGTCPPPEAFLTQERATLGERELSLLENHVAGCAACSAESQLAQTFEATETDPAMVRQAERIARRLAARPPYRRSSGLAALWRDWFKRPAVPAVATVAVALTLAVVGLRFQAAPPALPETPTQGVVRGSSLEVTAPTGELVEAPRDLSWQPASQPVKYLVTLRGVDRSVIWEAETSATKIAIEPSVLSALHPAVAYFWTVEAFDSDGNRIAWSPETRFLIQP